MEFALVLPVLLLVIMGIIQFGAIFNGHITVTNAAREGARLSVVGATDEEIEERVIRTSTALLLNNLIIDITPEFNDRNVGQDVTVSVQGRVPVIIPGFNIFMGTHYTVSANSVMRIEWLN